MTTKEKLLAEIREIIVQGEQHVLQSGRAMGLSRFTTGEVLLFADDRKHTDWICRCRNFVNVLGTAADAWKDAFKPKGDETQCDVVRARLGALEALERAVQNDLLVKIENLVHAEALGSLSTVFVEKLRFTQHVDLKTAPEENVFDLRLESLLYEFFVILTTCKRRSKTGAVGGGRAAVQKRSTL